MIAKLSEKNRTRFWIGLVALMLLAAAAPTTITSLTTYDTVQDMLDNHNPRGLFKSAYTRGRNNVGDGGGGMFYVTNSLGTTNLGTRFKSSLSATHAFVRNNDGPAKAAWFGAFPNDDTDDTVGLQAAIDYAMLIRQGNLKLPPGKFDVYPGAWGNHVLLLGYSSYDKSTGMTSATKSSPYQESPQFQGFCIEGEYASYRLARRAGMTGVSADEIYNKGTVLVAHGTMTGKYLFITGSWQNKIQIKNLAFVGMGDDYGTAIAINTGTTHTQIENCFAIHWSNGIEIGYDYLTTADVQADFTKIINSQFLYCETAIKQHNKNAYQTHIDDCSIGGCLVGVHSPIESGATYGAARIHVTDTFFGPSTESNGKLITGTVTAATATTITLTNLSVLTKSRNSSWVLQTNLATGTGTDLAVGMRIVTERDCVTIGAARPKEYGVSRRVTAVNTTTWTVTVPATVNTTALVGSRAFVYKGAWALKGSHFDVDNCQVEDTQVDELGFPGAVAEIYGFGSDSVLRGMTVNLETTDTPFSRIAPQIIVEDVFPTTYGQALEIDGGDWNVNFPKIQIGTTCTLKTKRMNLLRRLLVIDETGALAPNVEREFDSTFAKIHANTLPGNDALATRGRMGTDKYQQIGGLMKRPIQVVTSVPTTGYSGEWFIVDSDTPQLFRIKTGTTVGYYNSAALTISATNSVATDPHVFYLTTFTGLEDRHVVSIAGAGPAGAALETALFNFHYDGTNRIAWSTAAASTDVSGTAVSAVAPTIVAGPVEVGETAMTTAALTIVGGASGNDLAEDKRTTGVTQSFVRRIAANEWIFRSKTASRDLMKLTDASATMAAIFNAAINFTEQGSDPSASALTSGANAKDRAAVYMKSDKFVIAYNNAGTVTYISIPLDGSTTTWTHSTSAP